MDKTGAQRDLQTARANLEIDEEWAYTIAYHAMLRAGRAFMLPLKEEMPGSVKSSEKGSEKSSEKILEAIRGNRRISAREIGKRVGISPRAVEKILSRLKQQGYLNRVGPDRGGHGK